MQVYCAGNRLETNCWHINTDWVLETIVSLNSSGNGYIGIGFENEPVLTNNPVPADEPLPTDAPTELAQNPDVPDTPSTGAISLIGIGIATIAAGTAAFLAMKKED